MISSTAQHDASVLVGERHYGLLPADAFFQSHQPLADAVSSFACVHHCRLGALYQQGAHIVIAALGYPAQLGHVAGGVLAWHQPVQSAELLGAVELPEVADAGHQRRCANRADAVQRCGFGRALVAAGVRLDAIVAPLHLQIRVDPVQVGALQHQLRDAAQFVVGVLQHIGQHPAQRLGALREDQTELGEHAADAVDQRGPLGLVPSRGRCMLSRNYARHRRADQLGYAGLVNTMQGKYFLGEIDTQVQNGDDFAFRMS